MSCSPLIFAIGGAIYILGACIYIARIPERWRPGKFDLCGAIPYSFKIVLKKG
jgi:adiponectin receptor